MATKAKKNNQGLIIGICIAVVVIVVIVVAIVLATRGNNSGVNDSYFVSDGTKYVLTIKTEASEDEENAELVPLKMHSVYTYSGDTVTGLKIYYEYADSASAKKAYDDITNENKEGYKEVYLDGKYIVFIANESDYADITASEVKQNIDFMESLKNIEVENTQTETTEEVNETEEPENLE